MPVPSLQPYSNTLSLQEAKFLANRLAFGASQTQIQSLAGLSSGAAVDKMIKGSGITSLPQEPVFISEETTAWQTWLYKKADPEINDFVMRSFVKRWWLWQMYSQDTALEKLVFFLHTIITNNPEVNGLSRGAFFQNQLFRQYLINDIFGLNPAFQNYKQLIKKICVDNAMLGYLDGQLNEKASPNENFARELFELFSLGVTNEQTGNPNYQENDIKVAARVLTGWDSLYWYDLDPANWYYDPEINNAGNKIPSGVPKGYYNYQSGALVGNPSAPCYVHDGFAGSTPKQFSSYFDNKSVVPNTTLLTANGEPTLASMKDEISQLIDAVFDRTDNQAAKYFCRRLYRFFVSDKVNEAIVDELADDFRTNGYRIYPVLLKLIQSQAFFSGAMGSVLDDEQGAIIKSPLDIVVGTIRYFKNENPSIQIKSINVPSPDEAYEQLAKLVEAMKPMGFDFFEPFDVAGYDAYYQKPGYGKNWITVTTLAGRYKFIDQLTDATQPLGLYLDPLAWVTLRASNFTNAVATTPTNISGMDFAITLTQEVLKQLILLNEVPNHLTNNRLNYFAQRHLGSGQFTFAEWLVRWNNRTTFGATDCAGMLKGLLSAVMQSPEYQIF